MSTYQFILEHRTQYPVTLMCRVLEVATSAYYDWLERDPSPQQERRERLATHIRRVYDDTHGVYGSRKIVKEIMRRKIDACRNTVAGLMREMGLQSKAQKRRKHVVTTDSNHADPIAPNRLERDFTATALDQKWVADITYVPTAQGWAYVAVVLDLFSRLKNEWTEHRAYASVEEVRKSVFEYIEIFYNRERLHQALGYATPVEFEANHRGEEPA